MGQDTEYWEEKYQDGGRKHWRQERKRVSQKDRSKYKKTDQRKIQEPSEAILDEDLVRGRVLEIVPAGWIVESEEGYFTCTLRGVLKKERTRLKNLVTVGDWVWFSILPDQEGAIAHVEPRVSVLSRADNLSRRKQQLLAANIDQVLITASVVDPKIKPHLLDRYIIAARKGNMDPILVINKVDLLDPEYGYYDPDYLREQADLLDAAVAAYEKLGIPCLLVSATGNEGLDGLREVMKGKASVFSGQSGVGKTSLINGLTGLDLRVGETVEKTLKGAHTTTNTKLLRLDFGGWCIDTPGIKSFGVWDLELNEIEAYFSEIHEVGLQCHFPNCTHQHEPDCAVKVAVEQGEISALRFESYCSLVESVGEKHRRR